MYLHDTIRCKIDPKLKLRTESKLRQSGNVGNRNGRQIVISRRPFAPSNPLERRGSSD